MPALGHSQSNDSRRVPTGVHNALLGAVVSAAIIAVTVSALELLLRLLPADRKSIVHQYEGKHFVLDEGGFYRGAPGRKPVVATHGADARIVYSTVYTFDERGRRVTPIADTAERDRFAVFLGGSFTLGEGVADDETLPYYFGARTSRFVPYNYGFHGAGPFDALARLDSPQFEDEIPERNGLGFFMFIDSHIERVIGSSRIVGWHRNQAHYRRRSDGSFERDGTFATAHPVLDFAYSLLASSRTAGVLGLQLPPRTTDAHRDTTAAALAAVRDRFLAHYPRAELYIVMFPVTVEGEAMARRFEAMGIPYLHHPNLFDPLGDRWKLAPEELHASAAAYRLIANAIVADLSLD